MAALSNASPPSFPDVSARKAAVALPVARMAASAFWGTYPYALARAHRQILSSSVLSISFSFLPARSHSASRQASGGKKKRNGISVSFRFFCF
jgi:hypothetical protein